MNRRRGRIAAAFLVIVISLAGATGWLLRAPTGGSVPEAATVSLAPLIRAHAATASLVTATEPALNAPAEYVSSAARAARSGLLDAMDMVSSRARSPEWSDLDALLIAALAGAERVEQGGSGAEAARAQLVTVTEELEAAITTASQAEDSQAGPDGGTTGIAAGAALLVAGAALMALVLRSSTAPGTSVPRVAPSTTQRGPRPAYGVPARGQPSQESGREGGPVVPPDVLGPRDFARAVERERARCIRYEHDLSLVELTVAEASEIVHEHGEAALEYVVGSIAELVLDNTRDSDTVGVLDDRRIAVLAPETSVEQVENVALKLSRNVEVFPFSDEIHATVTVRCTRMRDGDDDVGIADL